MGQADLPTPPGVSRAPVRAAHDVPRDRLVRPVVDRGPPCRASLEIAEIDLVPDRGLRDRGGAAAGGIGQRGARREVIGLILHDAVGRSGRGGRKSAEQEKKGCLEGAVDARIEEDHLGDLFPLDVDPELHEVATIHSPLSERRLLELEKRDVRQQRMRLRRSSRDENPSPTANRGFSPLPFSRCGAEARQI